MEKNKHIKKLYLLLAFFFAFSGAYSQTCFEQLRIDYTKNGISSNFKNFINSDPDGFFVYQKVYQKSEAVRTNIDVLKFQKRLKSSSLRKIGDKIAEVLSDDEIIAFSSKFKNASDADLGSRTSWTTQQKANKIKELLESGSTIPQKVTYQQGTELFKVVKKGAKPSDVTEYWVTKTELDNLMAKGSNLESKSGLPLGSMADEYDIYKITANQPAPTYRSIIAPTNQRGYTTAGGATQTLVLDRSLWSTPVKYNTESFIPNF